jgi:hypothetical protein
MNEISSWLSGLVGANALICERDSERVTFLAHLIRSPLAGQWWTVPVDGGLLADYGLLQNILLPAQARGDASAGARLIRWQQRLAQAGIRPLPQRLDFVELSPWQQRLAGFMRVLVADAPALVFDNTCYGLQADEHRQAALLHGFFHRYFPFRPSLYLTVSALPPELNIPAGNLHSHATTFA